jgi:hypothetical protein
MSYIFQRLNVSDFRDAFRQCGRESQFSYGALGALYDYFAAIADDTGDPVELDPIAICCDWCEYDSARDAARENGHASDDDASDDDASDDDASDDDDDARLAWLMDQTTVLLFGAGTGIVVANF